MWPFNRKKDPLKVGIFSITFVNPAMMKPKKQASFFKKIVKFTQHSYDGVPFSLVAGRNIRRSTGQIHPNSDGGDYISDSIDINWITYA